MNRYSIIIAFVAIACMLHVKAFAAVNASQTLVLQTGGTERARLTATGLTVTGAVTATSFSGNGAGLTNITGDNLGNHTATTGLTMSSNPIYMFSNTYGLGIETNTLTNWSGNQFRWRIGGTSVSTGSQQMLLTTTGLNVSGSLSVNNDDTVSLPGFTWNGDTNTGMFWAGADTIGLSTGATERMRINASGVSVTGSIYAGNRMAINSNNSIHSAYYPDDTHYGYYAVYNNSGQRGLYFGYGNGSSTVSLALDTATTLSFTGGTLNMNTAKILNLATPTTAMDAANKAYVDNAVTGAADNLGNHTATADLEMGSQGLNFGNTVTDKIHLYSNTYGIGMESSTLTNWSGSQFRWRGGGTSASTGTQRMLLTSSGLTVSGYISSSGVIDAGGAIYGYAGDSATAPGYTWSGDTNTGMFWASPDIIGFSAGGTERARITSSGISTTGSIYLNSGGNVIADSADTTYNSSLNLYGGGDSTTGAFVQLIGKDHTTASGRIYMFAVSDTANALPLFNFYRRTTAGVNTTLMSIRGDGTIWGAAGGFETTGDLSLQNGGSIMGDDADSTYNSSLNLFSGASLNTGSSIVLNGKDHASFPGYVNIYGMSDVGGGTGIINFYRRTSAGVLTTLMTLAADTSVNIPGQLTAGGYATAGNINTDGNINITGDLSLVNGGNIIGNTSDNNSTVFYGGSDFNNGAALRLSPSGNASLPGRIDFYATSDAAASSVAHAFFTRTTAGVNTGALYILKNGNVEPQQQLLVPSMTSSRGNNVVCFGTSNGALTQTNNAAGCTVTSDGTLKKDVETFAPSLEKLLALRPVTFHWKDPKEDKETQYGFIAQEVNKVMPELTYAPTKDNKYWSMSTNALIPYLVKGLQEAMAIVKGNSTDIAALKAENTALRQDLAAMRKDVESLKAALQSR